ncbi:MAG: hypothetical protein ACRDS9_07110 [Pseudonocardiaceae bacterium]
MKNYWDVDALSAVYLEDSYVLDIAEAPGELKFRMEVVLTEQHPAYRPPRPNEQYCYANGWLVLSSITRTEWESRSTQRYTDATGEEDLGNIDFLERKDDHWWIGGDWGEVRVYTSADPQLVLTEPVAT